MGAMSAASGQKKTNKWASGQKNASHFGQSFAMRIVTRRKQMSGIVCTKFGEIEKKRTYENEHNTAWSHVLYQ